MGIYDRDYVRRESPRGGRPGGGGPPRLRALSVTAWIIIINVAVFVIDGFLPVPVWVKTEFEILPDYTEVMKQVDPVALKVPSDVKVIRDSEGQVVSFYREVFLEGTMVARQQVRPMKQIEALMHFSTAKGFLRVEFWRFVGFQFLHGSLAHILFNMIALYFFGPLVESFLGRKRYLAFYLLCGICGALMYTLLNLGGYVLTEVFNTTVQIPGLLFYSTYTPLIGASAGVFGVLMAGAYLAPSARVLLFFVIPMRLVTLAYGLVAVALFTVLTAGDNAGGEAGHLGGAIAGFYLVRHPKHLHGFFDFLGWIDPTSHHYRKHGPGKRSIPKTATSRDDVDRILDKISEKGLQSLSEKEKRILREASGE